MWNKQDIGSIPFIVQTESDSTNSNHSSNCVSCKSTDLPPRVMVNKLSAHALIMYAGEKRPFQIV